MYPPEDELARIDREWEAERERYLIASRYGRRRYVPSEAAAVMMALVVLGVGAFCFALAFSSGDRGGGGLFLPIGWAIVVVGLGVSFCQYVRARRYWKAHLAYRRRRASAKEQLKAAE